MKNQPEKQPPSVEASQPRAEEEPKGPKPLTTKQVQERLFRMRTRIISEQAQYKLTTGGQEDEPKRMDIEALGVAILAIEEKLKAEKQQITG